MRILVSPARHVPALLAASRIDRVVSLMSPDAPQPALLAEGRDHLLLRFNDIAQHRDGLIAPSPADVQAILDATEDVQMLLIHCHAGISRSTAALFAIACQKAPDADERDIAIRLRQASPQATPNRLMVLLADEILGRSGRMVSAVDAIGRGEDAFEGVVIDWRL